MNAHVSLEVGGDLQAIALVILIGIPLVAGLLVLGQTFARSICALMTRFTSGKTTGTDTATQPPFKPTLLLSPYGPTSDCCSIKPPARPTSGSGNSPIKPAAPTSGSGNSPIKPAAPTSGSGNSPIKPAGPTSGAMRARIKIETSPDGKQRVVSVSTEGVARLRLKVRRATK